MYKIYFDKLLNIKGMNYMKFIPFIFKVNKKKVLHEFYGANE